MSRKFSAARRAAFLTALGETGNQALSAERAKVSRSWVTLHRNNPEFDAACRAALAAAKARLGAAGARRPPRGWGTLDGVSLVVRGTGGSGGGKRVQIARARLKQWDPATEDRFLEALGATCNVKAACAHVAMSPASAYAHRQRWPAFAERWHAAVEDGYARLEIGLIENAANLFSATDVPPAMPMPPMDAAQAIHLLHMHRHAVAGIGGRPGPTPRRVTDAELDATILRIMTAIEKGDALSAARRTRDAAGWARRRPE